MPLAALAAPAWAVPSGRVEVGDDADDAPGVEDVLEETFRSAGKPILSVEDGDAVLASMSALPESVQVQLLLEATAPAPGIWRDASRCRRCLPSEG